MEDELEGHEIKGKKLMQFHRYNRVNHSNVRVAYFLTLHYILYKFMAWENINCAYKNVTFLTNNDLHIQINPFK